MARCRADNWIRAFQKSWAIREQAEQDRCEREQEAKQQKQGFTTTYVLFIDGKEQHRCTDWYEAHTVFTKSYGIDAWRWLSSHVTINDIPRWGATPAELEQNPQEKRRLKSNRTRHLNQHWKHCTAEEREAQATQELAQIIAKAREESAAILASQHDWQERYARGHNREGESKK